MVDENVRLLTLQQTLEKEADGKIIFFGLSVNETIRVCLLNGMSKRADKIKSDFKVPDKRCVYLSNALFVLLSHTAAHLIQHHLAFGMSSFTR